VFEILKFRCYRNYLSLAHAERVGKENRPDSLARRASSTVGMLKTHKPCASVQKAEETPSCWLNGTASAPGKYCLHETILVGVVLQKFNAVFNRVLSLR